MDRQQNLAGCSLYCYGMVMIIKKLHEILIKNKKYFFRFFVTTVI